MDEDTGAFNYTGLVDNMNLKAGSFYGIYITHKPPPPIQYK